MLDLRRRQFITLLGGAVGAWPLAAGAQQPEKNVRVGVLGTLPLPPVQRFFRKLHEYGYIEGRNLRLEARFAEGRDDRYPALAAHDLDRQRTGQPSDFCPSNHFVQRKHGGSRLHLVRGECRSR
jgi:hypothetical protein